MDIILVVNAGSSSVKFQIFDYSASIISHHLVKGQMDGIGSKPRLRATTRDGTALVDKVYEPEKIADVPSAIAEAGAWLRSSQSFTLAAVGHRVVHGGPDYDRPTVVNREILSHLEKYCSLAPLHQPNNLAPIRTLMERSPELAQVACFDTAFHRTHSPLADRYAISEKLYREGVRRYGFHGLSYEYVAGRLREIAPDIASQRVIVAHLGSGASMCALLDGKSVESTMGFTALDGLPMGTRPGQIDPGVLLYLITDKGMSAPALESFLYRDCGLKGLSGISNDVRELQASKEASAALAIDYFVYRIALNTGMLTAALGGLDAFVFTAGIGENSATIRSRIAEKLAWLGVTLDEKANQKAETLISPTDSKVRIHVVPTDEELMIARHTQKLIRK
jgi:acetate kinase